MTTAFHWLKYGFTAVGGFVAGLYLAFEQPLGLPSGVTLALAIVTLVLALDPLLAPVIHGERLPDRVHRMNFRVSVGLIVVGSFAYLATFPFFESQRSFVIFVVAALLLAMALAAIATDRSGRKQSSPLEGPDPNESLVQR